MRVRTPGTTRTESDSEWNHNIIVIETPLHNMFQLKVTHCLEKIIVSIETCPLVVFQLKKDREASIYYLYFGHLGGQMAILLLTDVCTLS